MQRYIAVVAITPSALRNLDAKGFVRTAQEFLTDIDLRPLVTIDPSGYIHWLDCQTEELMKKFPIKLWGPSRKSVDIFMVMAALNRFLCDAYALNLLDNALEVPLDNIVVEKVSTWARHRGLKVPGWKGIKHLQNEESQEFQDLARAMAEERGIPRGRLDVSLWSEGRGQS